MDLHFSCLYIAKEEETEKCKDAVRGEPAFIWNAGTLTSHNSGRQSKPAALSCGVKRLGREADHSTLEARLVIRGDTYSLSARPYDMLLN